MAVMSIQLSSITSDADVNDVTSSPSIGYIKTYSYYQTAIILAIGLGNSIVLLPYLEVYQDDRKR